MIQIIDKLPDNNLEKTFFWNTAFKLRDLIQENMLLSVKEGDPIYTKGAFTGYAFYDVPMIDNILFMNYGDKHDIPYGTVIFMNADEQYRIPTELLDNKNVVAVFKQYCPEDYVHRKLFHMPLGVPTGFNSSPPLPMRKRTVDVCFIGQYAWNRNAMLDVMKKLQGSDLESFIAFTSGFDKGIPRKAYSEIVRNSKLALCPSGTAGPETFRTYEAAVAGCIILTCPKPNNWIYEGMPAYYYEHENASSQIVDMIDIILSKSDKALQRRSDDTYSFYEERWSPGQVAERMYNELASFSNQNN